MLRMGAVLPSVSEETLVDVAIGDRSGGRIFEPTGFWVPSSGRVRLVLPKSVGQYYIDQGRRQLQAEMRDLLAVPRR